MCSSAPFHVGMRLCDVSLYLFIYPSIQLFIRAKQDGVAGKFYIYVREVPVSSPILICFLFVGWLFNNAVSIETIYS
jgi:hypothetical protein